MASEASPVPRTNSGFSAGTVKFVLAGGAIALAVAYLVVMGLQSSTVYFLTVSELRARGPAAQNQLYRVSGTLVPGTLVRGGVDTGIHFQIADPDATAMPLPVTYRGGQVPDIVGDNIEIVAEGKLDSQGTFVANTVLAKCPSKLENAPSEQHQYGQGGSA